MLCQGKGFIRTLFWSFFVFKEGIHSFPEGFGGVVGVCVSNWACFLFMYITVLRA